MEQSLRESEKPLRAIGPDRWQQAVRLEALIQWMAKTFAEEPKG
jgi:hypothetical protein